MLVHGAKASTRLFAAGLMPESTILWVRTLDYRPRDCSSRIDLNQAMKALSGGRFTPGRVTR